jgi:hypothetical protein
MGKKPAAFSTVMAGLDPAIQQPIESGWVLLDGPIKSGHDN